MSKKTPKEIVDNYVPKKPSFIAMCFFRIALKFVCLKHNVKFIYKFNKKEMKGRQVIIISDHASRDNYFFALSGYPFANPNCIIGYQNVFDKKYFKMLLKAGVIPKYLYAPDYKATKNTLRLIKEGASICFFPEGIQSAVGSTHPMNPASIKLMKSAGIDVVLCHSRGAYLSKPRFSKKWRKGYMEFEYSILFTKEELKAKSHDELYEKYMKEFSYNDFIWNKEKRIKYTCEDSNAKGLEQLLYYCPKCGSEFEIVNDKDTLVCKKCGNTIQVNEYYDLIKLNDSYLPFNRIDEWFNYQRKLVREEIKADDYKYEYDAELLEICYEKLLKNRYIVTGKGHVTIDKDNITYNGTRNNEEFIKIFKIDSIPSAPLDCGDDNEFYYENEYYSLRPLDNPNTSTKIMMIIEELHNLKDPSWNKYSRDVYDKE